MRDGKKLRRLNVSLGDVDCFNLATIRRKTGATNDSEAVRRALSHYAVYLSRKKKVTNEN